MEDQLTSMGTTCGESRPFRQLYFDIKAVRRFCQIKYFFETRSSKHSQPPQKMFHGQWFLHGSKTALNQLAHPQALYPVNMCDDNHVNSIYSKCNFKFLQPEEEEPPEDSNPRANNFHSG
jgi:DNA (cytosine-5)-methyltransferase 1